MSMFLIVISLVLVLGPVAGTSAAPSLTAEKRGDRDVFTGTVESIDPDMAKMVVKSDIGRAEPVTIKNPVLLQDIHQGDRVSVELDDRHVATKITRVAPPELPSPPPAETGY
jgi:hypothetical protein